MKIPESSDLVSITRGQLLAFIDTNRRVYRGPCRTAAQKKKKEEFEKNETVAVEQAQKVWRTVSDWSNDPKLEGVLVLEVKDMWSSALGQKTFVQLGPHCTWQLKDVNSSTCVGDLPSRRHYATYYYLTCQTVIDHFKEYASLQYGPFEIKKKGYSFQAMSLVENVRTAKLTDMGNTYSADSLTTLLQTLDEAVLSDDQLLRLRTRKWKLSLPEGSVL